MKKFISQIFIYFALVVVISTCIDYCFTNVFQNGNTNKNQWLNKKINTSYDVGVIGSSRAWWNINMNKFNEELGLNCISLSNNHFPYSEILLRLKQFYANGNSVDLLLIQTEYWAFFDQESAFSNTVYNNIPYLDDTTTYNYLSNRSNEWVKLKYVPLWRYSEYNRQWGMEEFIITLLGKRNPIYDSTGTFFSNNKFYGKKNITFDREKSFKINPDFLAIHEFCKSKDIKVSIFTSPIYNADFDTKSQYKMESLLDSINLDYHNYISIYKDSTFFNDNVHLSIKGGELFTDTLIHQTKLLLPSTQLH